MQIKQDIPPALQWPVNILKNYIYFFPFYRNRPEWVGKSDFPINHTLSMGNGIVKVGFLFPEIRITLMFI